MATRAPEALSRTRAPGAQAGHSQDPAWSPCRVTRHPEPLASGRGQARFRSAHPAAARPLRLTAARCGPLLAVCSQGPGPSLPITAQLGAVFPAAWKARAKKFAEYWFSSPSHPQEIIARNGNLTEQSRPLLHGRRCKVRVRGGQAAAAFPGRPVCILGDRVDLLGPAPS